MLEWIKNLEPEFLILFGVSFVLIVLLLVILGKNQKVLDLIGKRALVLKEDLLHRDDLDVIDILIANTSYVNVEAGAVGFIYQKVYLPLSETSMLILARDSHKISIPLQTLREFVIGRSDTVKKIDIYVEDSLGRRTVRKAVNATRKLKEILKEERKNKKREDKKLRFETGTYLFFERLGLVFKWIFSPFTKLSRTIKTGLNKRLKNREVKLEIKEKEKKHKDEMQQVFDEQRREDMILQAEKRILAEKKAKQAEIKLQEKKRREDMEKVKEETRKFEEEMKVEQEDNIEGIHDENEMKINENSHENESLETNKKVDKEDENLKEEPTEPMDQLIKDEQTESIKVTPKKKSSKSKKTEEDINKSEE